MNTSSSPTFYTGTTIDREGAENQLVRVTWDLYDGIDLKVVQEHMFSFAESVMALNDWTSRGGTLHERLSWEEWPPDTKGHERRYHLDVWLSPAQ